MTDNTTIKVDVYEDAQTARATETVEADSLAQALVLAGAFVRSLRAETDAYDFGTAGDDELFEVFPRLGHGTVVVKRCEEE